MAALIDTISPGRGRATDTGVVIDGSGFSPTPTNNTVTVDGQTAVITAESATQITITIPGSITEDRHVVVSVTNDDDATTDTIFWWSKLNAAALATEDITGQVPGPFEDPDPTTETPDTAEAKDYEKLATLVEFVRAQSDSIGGKSIFGDGSDGATTISSDTDLTRDVYYSSLTIDTTFTLDTKGFRIFSQEPVAVDGTGAITNSGADGADAGSLGAGGIEGSIGGGTDGTAGGTVAATDADDLLDAIGAAGGAGGAGSSGAGGAAGTRTPPIEADGGVRVLRSMPAGSLGRTLLGTIASGGTGGGGGGGDGTSGGGGGGGGGVVIIIAPAITGTGTISADGGDGGSPPAGNRGGGGGGGGGFVLLVTELASAITPTAAAGAAGAGSGTGGNGNAGAAGTVIQLVNA